MKRRKKYLNRRILIPLWIGFLLFAFVKLVFFDLVPVRSPSMQPTLMQGEWVFVRKVFTPRLNDIVLVRLPISDKDSAYPRTRIFKRVLALPGDSVAVRKGRVYRNGEQLPANEGFRHNYIAKILRPADTAVFAEKGVEEKYPIDDSCVYLLILSDRQYEEIQADKRIYSLQSNAEDSALYDENVYPYNAAIKWNKDYFGPLYVPKKGDELELNVRNIVYYEHFLTGTEGNALEIEKGKIFINEKETSRYTVKQNYYFVAGDNFDNSIDSRHWGLVPEKNIKGLLMFSR
jgi:signal peptidase I